MVFNNNVKICWLLATGGSAVNYPISFSLFCIATAIEEISSGYDICVIRNKTLTSITVYVLTTNDGSSKKRPYNAIIIGNEGSGLSLELKELCDDFCYINMTSKCESLNASVAASIIMYEAYHE